ncbi:MAG TPA: pyridoxal-phosphate dependent enzyme [Gaiellales bacterium]
MTHRRVVVGAPHPDRLAVGGSADALAFHRGLPGYEATRLVAADSLARELGIERLYVKDESRRLGLPAFKFLGASWAISRLLGGGSDLAALAHHAREQGIERLTTATDGNHGRAVARMAALLGLRSTIYVPAAMRPARRDAIVSEGAELVEVADDYDEAVRRSLLDAAADPACRAVNDADLDGASPVAGWVIDGYATLFAEIDEQMPEDAAIDTVLLQTGVGAFAAAGVRFAARHGAVAIAVDPAGAPCIAASLAAGHPVTVETSRTAMAGLDAGTPSAAAWPSLADGLAGAIVVDDGEADEASRDLAAIGIEAGESGAAGLAGLHALLEDERCEVLQPRRGTRQALVIVTEGATDPERYEDVLSALT